MTVFQAGEQVWIDRFGKLRNVVRQELIARQLARSTRMPGTALDVGCGQGEQGLRLLSTGWAITGIDPSENLLQSFRAAAVEVGKDPELIVGELEGLDDLLDERTFDLVCAHGLLMHLDERATAIQTLASRVADGGCLSITFRNAHGLAMRPGLRGDWPAALEALHSTAYVNELGLSADADRLDDIEEQLNAAGLDVTSWFGVRVLTDSLPADTPVPVDDELSQLFDAEDQACSRDPYRWLGSQIHVIGRRSAQGSHAD